MCWRDEEREREREKTVCPNDEKKVVEEEKKDAVLEVILRRRRIKRRGKRKSKKILVVEEVELSFSLLGQVKPHFRSGFVLSFFFYQNFWKMLDCIEERKGEFLKTVPILALILLATIYYYNRRSSSSRDVRRSRRDGERLSKVRVVRKRITF